MHIVTNLQSLNLYLVHVTDSRCYLLSYYAVFMNVQHLFLGFNFNFPHIRHVKTCKVLISKFRPHLTQIQYTTQIYYENQIFTLAHRRLMHIVILGVCHGVNHIRLMEMFFKLHYSLFY